MKLPFSSIKWDWLWIFPWHPLLIALYAPLELGSYNMGQIQLSDTYRSLIVSEILAIVIFCLCWVFLRRWQAAGMAASILIVLFLSYGHVYNLLDEFTIGGVLIGRHRYVIMVWALAACLGLWWTARKPANFSSLTSTLNLISALLVIWALVPIVLYELRTTTVQPTEVEASHEQQILYDVKKPSAKQLPDIYYIILDAYGRSDVLLNFVHYDNSAFLNELQSMGFYVAPCAQSNYSSTELSLSSSLNMDYLSALDPALTPDNTDRLPLWNLIKENQVSAILRKLGYHTFAFETGFAFDHFNDLDAYYTLPSRGVNEFENLYISTTFGRFLDDAGLLAGLRETPEDRKRERILFDLRTLQELPLTPGPKFVFAHLVIPHQPFVFGPNGEALTIQPQKIKSKEYYSIARYGLGYRNQAIFISRQISQLVKDIIEKSPTPPIIIIQGDHGPSHYNDTVRMQILNAYYFPDAQPQLYPTITPVNTFRVLFNTYFETKLDLLEDVSRHSEYPHAYQYEIIPNQCKATSK